MHYIIDANNLAGSFNILKEEDFDKKLAGIIKKWLGDKNHMVDLVFDSSDLMGDKIKDNNITLIYTPKDNYYKSADDKIVELVEMDNGGSGHELVVITDDIEIKEKIRKIINETGRKIKLVGSTEFSKKINNNFAKRLNKTDDDEDKLNKDDVKKINNELLRSWR